MTFNILWKLFSVGVLQHLDVLLITICTSNGLKV